MALLAALIAIVYFLADYKNTKAEIEDRAEAYAVSMATDVRWYIDVAKQTLNRAADRYRQNPTDDLKAALSEALSDLPAGVVLAIYNSDGESQAFRGVSSRPTSVADRRYFLELKEGKDWTVSNLIADRVTGTKTFAIGLALRNGSTFEGAVVAYAPMHVFSESWLSVGGAQSNAFLVHDQGWITARLPPIDSDVYDHPVSMEFVSTFTGAKKGSYWARVSPIDGIERVLGFARVPSTPLIAVIGVSPQRYMAALWRRISLIVAILTPILLLLGYASWRIRKLIRQLETTTIDLEAALAKNEMFMLEIHHRVKNNFQSALSLVRRFVSSREVVAEIEPRIFAMVAVHEHIYKGDRLTSISARHYLTEIAKSIVFASPNTITLKTDIADIQLTSELAMPLGQLLNEAMINAVKYGFGDGRSGTVSVDLSVNDAGKATMTIWNDGAPLPTDRRSGIGSRLMPAFAAQIGGTLETASTEDGVKVTVHFPYTSTDV